MKLRPVRAVLVLIAATTAAHGDDAIRHEMAPGVSAMSKSGRSLGVEAALPQGNAAQVFLQKYLAIESEWIGYRGRKAVFIPIDRLKPSFQREVLLAIYPADVVDKSGWRHTVVDPRETLWSLCEWIAGNGAIHEKVKTHAANKLKSPELHKGQVVVVAVEFLSAVMKAPTAVAAAPAKAPPSPRESGDRPAPRLAAEGLLGYGKDSIGDFASYRLEKGEALFTAVVVRFTDIQDNADILDACQTIASRSRIRDMRDIDAGTEIKIPLDMLSDQYQPEGSEGRKEYEVALGDAKKLRKSAPKSTDLSDVIVILDAGHGGEDPGAYHSASGLYEDEINYDIVCRIKGLLESRTSARLHLTVLDRSSGFAPSNAKKFALDKDEDLTTDPPFHNNQTPTVSANFRWMLANALFDKEVARGADPDKVIFTSVHTDSIANESIRGAMIYVPGAKYRRGEEVRTSAVYASTAEGRKYNRFSSTDAELRRDEALSRNFAEVILAELTRRQIKIHDNGAPIRNVIRRARNEAWVPAVIRNTKVPTKILLETANLKSPVDRQRLADPEWRQSFAEAYVAALVAYFGQASPGALAMAD